MLAKELLQSCSCDCSTRGLCSQYMLDILKNIILKVYLVFN